MKHTDDTVADLPDGDGAGARRAALLMHALAEPDRAWLLEQLPAGDKARLERLLVELGELGIGAVASAVPDLLQAPVPFDEVATAGADTAGAAIPGVIVDDLPAPALVARVRSLPPMRLASLLRDEPDALVVRVLAETGRASRAAVLRGLGLERRDRLAALLAAKFDALSHGASPASSLQCNVLKAIVRRDASLPPHNGEPRGPAAWISASWRRSGRRPSAFGAGQ